jgi:anaerobic magnesium-protoporphyrin IX monomethyl ester cyclase
MKSNNKPVILLQPPDLCKTFTRSGSVYPPLGLCQLAAVDKNDVIQVIDAEGEGLTNEQTEKLLQELKPRIVGLSATSFTLEIVEKWANFCKSINSTVIVGGPHPSLSPLNTFEKCPSIDFIVRGEGEIVINELIEQILYEKFDRQLAGVCSRKNNDFHIDDEILKVDNFAQLPFPDLSNMPIKNYWCPDAVSLPMVTMMTTRGCPYRCEFCSSPAVMGKKVRGWGIEQVVSELKYLHFELGVKEISFVDDVFTINRKRTIELCNEIVKQNIKITWFCNARADHIDDEIARAMKLAGCHQTYLGFESGSQVILNNIKKGTTIERLVKGAEILKKHGIKRSIGFVLGLPGENEETVLKSIELAQSLQPERLQFTRFTPLVGSPLENFRMNENGFHKQGDDQIGNWIKKAYQECQGVSWGKESW